MKNILLPIGFLFICFSAVAQQTSTVTLYTDLMEQFIEDDIIDDFEWFDFEITRFDNDAVLYEEFFTLNLGETYQQEFCFTPGIYRLNTISVGAFMNNFTVTLSNGELVEWAATPNQYFLIEIDQSMVSNVYCDGPLISMNSTTVSDPVEPITTMDETIDVNLPIPTEDDVFDLKTYLDQNQLNLEFELIQDETIEVIATSYAGHQQVLFPKQLKTKGKHTQTLGIDNLESGIYFISVLHNGIKTTNSIRIQ